jgi:hypothetical protein
MTSDPLDDRLVRQLAALQPAAPDAARSARTRLRCRAVLARQRAESTPRSVAVAAGWQRIESALVTAGCVGYLTDLVRRALTLYGMKL